MFESTSPPVRVEAYWSARHCAVPIEVVLPSRRRRSGGWRELRAVGEALPSASTAVELARATADPSRLSDAELIDAIVGYERLAGWAQARQARVLAEFARRRPGDDPVLAASDKVSAISRYAPDEVGLALRLSRLTAGARLGRSAQVVARLPETLRAWLEGRLDERKVAGVCEATHYLDDDAARAVQDRVVGRAPGQTLAQLKASLTRAVLAVDPDGAAERHRRARRDRRVGVGAERDGMASLWALLSAPDARAAYEWLSRLARGLGADDPRGMDARRADLAAALLTGQLTYALDDRAPAASDEARPGGAAGEPGQAVGARADALQHPDRRR